MNLTAVQRNVARQIGRATIALAIGWASVATDTLGQEPPRSAFEKIVLETKDGVQLHCRFYASQLGETAVPIILLHGWKEQGGRMAHLARLLNSPQGGGCAVIVPDLRGHGASTLQITKTPTGDAERTLTAEGLKKPDFEDIVKFDLEAVKTYLITQHNQRRLNIDRLCVAGAEMGALAALYWTIQDWEWPAIRDLRQGQDVKALVMISTPKSFQGITAQIPLRYEALRTRISVQILFGEHNSSMAGNARRMNAILKRSRDEHLGYEFVGLPTTLQGTMLLNEQALQTERFIARFIKRHVLDRKDDFPWEPRGTNVQTP